MNQTASNEKQELIDELNELKEQMLESLDRAATLIRASGYDGALLRAESYWLAHARMAITHQHSYLGGSMVSMEDTIEEITHADEEDGGD